MIIKKNSQKYREVSKRNTEPEVSIGTSENLVAQEVIDVEEKSKDSGIKMVSAQNAEPEIDLFDVENIDFTQRQERRRGSRRRGYRRIDDRNLVSRAQEEAETIKKSAFEEGYRKGLEQAASDMEAFRKS